MLGSRTEHRSGDKAEIGGTMKLKDCQVVGYTNYGAVVLFVFKHEEWQIEEAEIVRDNIDHAFRHAQASASADLAYRLHGDEWRDHVIDCDEDTKIVGYLEEAISKRSKRVIPKPPSWTDEQLDYIRQNYKSQSDKEMAEHLGKLKSSVSEKRIKLRLLRQKPYQVDKREVSEARCLKAFDLRKEGKTYREVGEYFGVSGGRARQLSIKGERIVRRSA